MILLAGDVGGTKTQLALFSSAAPQGPPLLETNVPSRRYADLTSLVRDFLDRSGQSVGRAVFAVAGPVLNGRAALTNLPWTVDRQSLGETFGFRQVDVVNDLFATACALPYLQDDDLLFLQGNAAQRQAAGHCALVAPGTGLGEAFLFWDGRRHHPCASEGGHADFAPGTEREMALWAYLHEREDHVSCEDVCSGRALPALYRFLRDRVGLEEPPALAARLAAVPDPVPVLIEAALDGEGSCDLCLETMRLFAGLLGAEAGNFALKVLPQGGVYLAGGLPRRLVPFLKEKSFLQAFLGKGRLSGLMARFPVAVVMSPTIALLGAAVYGWRQGATGDRP